MKKMIGMLGVCIVGALLTAGCILPGVWGSSNSSVPNGAFYSGDQNRVALCIGLTEVDPAFYGGWNGKTGANGCSEEAKIMYTICKKEGLTSKVMVNSEATWENVVAFILFYGKKMNSGGLLVITMASHGGQIADNNGDERDGLDETLCLWNGHVRDDEMLKILRKLPSGVRILLINDQCRSAGNFKGFTLNNMPFVIEESDTDGEKALVNIQIIQFAACKESGNSYGQWIQNLYEYYSKKHNLERLV